MKNLCVALLLLAFATPVWADCPPAGYSRARLDALKVADFVIANDAERNAFARAMTACLADPDPTLRDGIAYEAYFTMLRHRQLSDATMLALATDLEARLTAPEEQGFERPFAALALAEVARADRVQAFMTPAQRQTLLDTSLTYFTSVRDYRGFDEREGWRHGVAHGADLMLQLALNPAFGRAELARIRDAVATQISPPSHFYVYGEADRLARPILYIAQRNVFTAEEWTAWLSQFPTPAPAAGWAQAASTQAGLAKIHNVGAFLFAIYVNAKASNSAAFAALLPGTEGALRAMPN